MEKIDNGIYRILIPFEKVTTTVYLYMCEQGTAIIDSATYSSDVDENIIPALKELGIPQSSVKYLLLTHRHGDHSGGIRRLAELFPDAIVGTSYPFEIANRIDLEDNKIVFGSLKGIHLPGHTDHTFGFYDTDTKTLLSGDCLQLDGVGKYRNGIQDFEQYAASINKLKKMDIERIVAAHEFDPLGSVAEGKQAVMFYLDTCIRIAETKKSRFGIC